MDIFKKIVSQITDLYKKSSLTQKLIALGVIVVVIIAVVFMFSTSAKPTKTILYSDLNVKDFGAITKKLQEMNYKFVTRGNEIWVDPKDKEYIKMKLAQVNIIPEGIKGWELFDTEKWSTTDFERDINKRRAIVGEITRHIKLLDDVEDCSINLAMPKKELYVDQEKPVTASIIITPAPFSDILKNPDKIKGIINLVAFAVDGLDKDNIVITDNHGNILSDFTSADKDKFLDIAKKEFRIKELLRTRMLDQIREGLKKFIGEDKVDMNLDLELDFDQQELKKTEYLPTVLKKDNPLTPYDESQVVEKVTRSEKTVNEKFEGPGFVPEGAPGVEPNLPPGYKEAANKYAKYKKDENIRNYEIGQLTSKTKRSPYKITRVSAAVWVDGIWKRVYNNKGQLIITNNKILREYSPRTQEEIRKFTDIVKASVGFNAARGDQVVVRNVQFDRSKQFEREDLKELKSRQLRRIMVISLLVLVLLFVGTLMARAVRKEMERRRRLQEEEFLRQQELLRQKALEAAEAEGPENEMSLEEQARLEMEENAKNLAKEHPDTVAQLLRTWMMEE